MSQVHKRFTSEQVKELLNRYLKNEVEREYLQEILGIKKRRFFVLLKQYKEDPLRFTIQYQRRTPSRSLSPKIEKNILRELTIEKKTIEDKDIPLKFYNYSYIKNRLQTTYRQKVSLNTIIHRARKHGFYLKKPKRTTHDREVLTRYVGELIQHDSSFHLWAPAAQEKWYLITSLDDHSRFLFYLDSHPGPPNRHPSLWPSFRLLCRFSFHLPICPGKRLRLAKTPPFDR